MPKNIHNNKGITIIEILLVIAILSYTVFFIISIFPFGLSKSKLAEKTTIATNLSQAKIEELISQSYESLNTGTTTEASLANIDQDFSDYSRQTAINFLDSNLNLSPNDLGFKKIKVIVSWKDSLKNATNTVSLITIAIDN